MQNSQLDTLDNIVWYALNTKHAHFAQGKNPALRYHPDVSLFAGLENYTPAAFQALRTLIPQGEYAFLVTAKRLQSTRGIGIKKLFNILQMVDMDDAKHVTDAHVSRLTIDDVNDMVDLVKKTEPGPFRPRTIEMGNYIGIRENGKLIAMAGERFQVNGYSENSAVCVDECYRRKGLANCLMNILRYEITQRGSTPILHVRSDAPQTIALYEKFGFVIRKEFYAYMFTHVEK